MGNLIPPPPRCVGVFLPWGSGFYANVLRGIQRFALEHRHWRIAYHADSAQARIAAQTGHLDGVLGETGADWGHAVAAFAGPRVQVANNTGNADIPRVIADEPAIGRLVASHFLAHGHYRFAFIGFAHLAYVDGRLAGFTQTLRDHGHDCAVHRLPENSFRQYPQDAARFIASLGTPLALMACNDECAIWLMQIIRDLHLHIPTDVALVGVDNQSMECEMSDPPLSSVAQPMEQIGYAAADLLDALMAGQPPPTNPLLFPPTTLVARESSAGHVVDDPLVRRTLQFIRAQTGTRLTVAAAATAAGIPRRTLERRFRLSLGRSILQEIHRAQTDRAKEILAQTSLPLAVVARQCGFQHVSHFCTAFRAQTQQTPTQFRLSRRLPTS